MVWLKTNTSLARRENKVRKRTYSSISLYSSFKQQLFLPVLVSVNIWLPYFFNIKINLFYSNMWQTISIGYLVVDFVKHADMSDVYIDGFSREIKLENLKNI